MADSEREEGNGSPPLTDGSEDEEGLFPWFWESEAALMEEHTGGRDYISLSSSFRTLHNLVLSVLTNQISFLECADQVESSDQKLDLLLRWQKFVLGLDSQYRGLLNDLLLCHEGIYASAEEVISRGKESIEDIVLPLEGDVTEEDFPGLAMKWKRLKETKGSLEIHKEKLSVMLQVPRPLDIRISPDSLKNEKTPLIEVLKEGEREEDKEQDAVCSSSPVSRVIDVANKAEMVDLECMNVIAECDDKLGQLQPTIDMKEQKMLDELTGLEMWLGKAESLLLAEPIREFESNMVTSSQLGEDQEFYPSQQSQDSVSEELQNAELMASPSPPLEDEEESQSPDSPIHGGEFPYAIEGVGGNGAQKSPLQVDNLVTDLGFESPPIATGLLDDEYEKDKDKMEASVDVTLSDQDYVEQVEEYIFSPSTPKAVKGKKVERSEEDEEPDDELPSPTVFDYSDYMPPLRGVDQMEVSGEMNGEVTGNATSYGADEAVTETENHLPETDEEQGGDMQELNQSDDMEGLEWEGDDDAFDDEGDDFDSRGSFDDSSEEGVEGSSTRTEASGIEWVKHLGVFAYHAEKSCIPIAAGVDTVSPLPYTALIQQLQELLSGIDAYTQCKDAVLSKCSLLVSIAESGEREQELQLRMDAIKEYWKTLEERVQCRVAEMKFELAQTNLQSWLIKSAAELSSHSLEYSMPEEMRQSLATFRSYFDEIDQFEEGRSIFASVMNSAKELTKLHPDDEEKVARIISSLREGFQCVCAKIEKLGAFLEQGVDLWEELDRVATPLGTFLKDLEEEITSMGEFGSSLAECEEFQRKLEDYREKLRSHYPMLKVVVSTGNKIVPLVKDGSDAHSYLDNTVQGITGSWQKSADSLTEMEKQLSHVLITLQSSDSRMTPQEYEELLEVAQDFVGRVREMAGDEICTASAKERKLLPKFMQLQQEIDAFGPKMVRLFAVKQELISGSSMDDKEKLDGVISQLQSEWDQVCSNTKKSLETLWEEHSIWSEDKLVDIQRMVSAEEAVVTEMCQFVEGYPLTALLNCHAHQLLRDIKRIVSSYEDQVYDLEGQLHEIQQELSAQEKEIAEADPGSAFKSSMESVEELVQKWEGLQSVAVQIQPVLQLYTAQLELALSVQEMRQSLIEVGGESGDRRQLEAALENARDLFSEAKFENLRQLSYDLDTVYRDSYCHVNESVTDPGTNIHINLPSSDEVSRTNMKLTNQIGALVNASGEAKSHLLEVIGWWNEFETRKEELMSWMEDAESRMRELASCASDTTLPENNPLVLLGLVQDLKTEFEDLQQSFSIFVSTSESIAHDMELKQFSSVQLTSQVSLLTQKWSSVESTLTCLHHRLQEETNEMEKFLDKLYNFSERLNSMYIDFYDEYCTTIPSTASPETVERHRQKLEKFKATVSAMEEEFHGLKEESRRWGDRFMPDHWLHNFREVSPGMGEESQETPTHQRVNRQLATSETRLANFNRMLQERSQDLELCQGSAAAILNTVDELLHWVEEEMEQEFLHQLPPGELDRLKSNAEGLQVLREKFESKKQTLERLLLLAESAESEISPANLARIKAKMAQLTTAWERMESAMSTSSKSTETVLQMVEAHHTHCQEFSQWLTESEEVMKDCGPIGANLQRVEEQEVILQALSEKILECKKTPDDLSEEASKIVDVAEAETCDPICQMLASLQTRFSSLEEDCAESVELCEEAKTDLQEYHKLEGLFASTFTKLKEGLEDLKSKPKKPLGNIQEVLDEHVDYVSECESQLDVFNKMYEAGLLAADKYKPSDKLQETLANILNQWTEFVQSLDERWMVIRKFQTSWEEYASKVKGFLSWVTEEAETFSKDVTEINGEKGVFDHMESCKTLKTTLEGRAELLEEIASSADFLRPEDGKKANGTSDVDSRQNDVNMHWNSICLLLTETLSNLTTVYIKVCHILEITRSESDWLDQLSQEAADRAVTRGNIELIKAEIKRNQAFLEQMAEHKPAAEVIIETEEFLLEHSRRSERPGIEERVKLFQELFESTAESVQEYVDKMESALPLWEEFNQYQASLSQWLIKADQAYSNDLKVGNAIITEQSLRNAESLQQDLLQYKPLVSSFAELTKKLAVFCVPGDQEFVTESTNSISSHTEMLAEETEAKREQLETRMESWKVFPVKEAMSVQDFVDSVAEEMDAGFDDDECTGEDLLEVLRKLEALQQRQAVQGASVAIIDQSIDSDNVRKALSKNPDISTERSNLLEGWSSASQKLSDKVALLRLKANMTLQLEKSSSLCRESLQQCQECLSKELPPSPFLQQVHQQILHELNELGKEYDDSVQVLIDHYQSYYDDARVQVPRRLEDELNQIRNQHAQFIQDADQRTTHIVDTLQLWEEYQSVCDGLSRWISTEELELASLGVFPLFLTEFLSLPSRFDILKDELQEREKEQQLLENSIDMHLFGDDEQIVEERERIAEIISNWQQLRDRVQEFPKKMLPWQQMVDLQYDLKSWLEEVTSKIAKTEQRLRDIERDRDDPMEVLPIFKIHRDKLAEKDDGLKELESAMDRLLSECDRLKYKPARIFSAETNALLHEWRTLEETLEKRITVINTKVTSWRQKARECILEVPVLKNLLQQKQQKVAEMEAERLAMKSTLPVKKDRLCFKVFLFIALFVLLALLVVVVVAFISQPTLILHFKYWLVKSGIYSTVRLAGKVEF